MHKLAIAALAAAMGLAWSALPAIGAGTTPKEDKTIKDKVKEKTSEVWDKTKEKTSEAWDKTKEKTVETKDKIKAKVKGTDDKAEDKAERAKDKADSKMDRAKDKMRETKDKIVAKADMKDVRNAQQALKDKGHDPGPIDGIHGPRTSAALRSYQKAENLKVTGQMDTETRMRLMGGQASTTTSTPSASPATGTEAPEKLQKP